MKTRIITLLFTILINHFGFSQVANGSVSLSLKLYPINTLIVNSSEDQRIINLEYKTKEDYLNGVSNVKENHLIIYSTGGYQINVQSGDLISTNNLSISASTIEIIPSSGSSIQESAIYNKTPLGFNESPIVKSNLGGINNTYTIEYKGKGGNEYLSKYVSNQNPTIYTTNVVYTIISK